MSSTPTHEELLAFLCATFTPTGYQPSYDSFVTRLQAFLHPPAPASRYRFRATARGASIEQQHWKPGELVAEGMAAVVDGMVRVDTVEPSDPDRATMEPSHIEARVNLAKTIIAEPVE